MTKRFKLSGSNCHRWIKCPGSAILKDKMPPEPPSPAASLGTAAHELLERALTEKVHPRKWHKTEINGFRVDNEMVESVMLAVDTLKKRMKLAGVGIDDIRIEDTLEYEGYDMGGTPDIWFYNKSKDAIYVMDFKYGSMPVEAKYNQQLLFYAALIVSSDNSIVENVHLTIIQPRSYHDLGPVRSWTAIGSVFDKFIVDMIDAADKIEKGSPLLVTGTHCEWCPAISICPEIKKQALEMATLDFSVEITPEQISKVLSKRKAVEHFFKQVSGLATATLERGVKIPGWKLVKKKTHRRWADKELVIDRFIEEFGEKIFETKDLLSPAQLSKVVGRDKVDDLCETPDGYTLVEETDSRQAYLPMEEFKGGGK